MHKSIFFVLLFLAFFNTHAQTTQWVSTILEVSTEQTPREFSSEQIIGKPNVNPGTGESPNAWMPYKDDKEEYVKVGFKNTIKIRQIAIAESYNPGAVYQIYVYDRSGNEFLINTFEPGPIELTSRMLHVFFDLTEYEVSAVKIVFNCEAVPGFIGIDAIAISNSTVPIKQEVVLLESEIVNVSPQRLSETVNTVYNELKPLITPDGKILLFSRQNHPGNFGGVDDPEDIWFSLWDEEKGEWQEAKNMGSPLNNSGPNYIGSITPDGNTVVITLGNKYKRNKKMTAGVSMSTRTSEGWSTPVPFKILNGTNFHKKSNYFMANNRKVMLMSIEGELSFGSRDIYVSFLISDRKWSKPLNLGSQINTVMEEASPFLAADDKTLYFSTDGYTGYGKHDIFISRRLDDTWTNWSEPENLGSQINSPEEDAFFNIPPTGEYGYFNRNLAYNNSYFFLFYLPNLQQPDAVLTVNGFVYD
jgi:OOP family OmpA-OmpF porin